MKKLKLTLRRSRFNYFLMLISCSQILLFTQCKKEEEVMPSINPPTAGVPNDSGDETTPPVTDETGENSGTPNPETDNPGTPDAEIPGEDNSTTTPPSTSNPSAVVTVKSNQSVVDGKDIKPGTLIKLDAGSRGVLTFRNLSGTSAAPVIIMNNSGKTTINSSGGYAMKFENCKNFRLSGSGGGGEYGIQTNGGHIGMSLEKLTSDFSIDHVEVMNCGFAGIMAKTDPSCDPATWRGNFVMQNLVFNNNFIHDVKGEGFYIGNSFFANGRNLSCGNILPHEIRNVALFNNKLLRTGCEGIQAGCIVSGMKIYNNVVENFGISPFAAAQNNGIQIGEGSTGLLYNNIVKNGPGNGIIVLGSGNTKIYNNLVVNAGSYGAFIDNRGPASGDIAFINNTFINPKDGGLKTYNELVNNKFYNNIIVGTSPYFIYGSGASGDEKNNLTKSSVNDCGFNNPGGGDYRLKAGSPAIDKGLNVATYGIKTSLSNKARPSGSAYDIGAYEF